MRRWEIALTQRREMIDCIIVVGRMGVKLVGGWGLVDDVMELMDVAVSGAEPRLHIDYHRYHTTYHSLEPETQTWLFGE